MVSSKKLEIINFLKEQKLSLVEVGLLRELTGLTNQQSLASFIDSLIKLGVLERAEKGRYLVKDNLGNDFQIANLLYRPSYVSLETALNLYGILSQFPTEVTSVTTKRKKVKQITGKLYVYYHLSPRHYWGFEKRQGALIAQPEKALLDSIYLTSKGIKRVDIEELDLSSIRTNRIVELSRYFPQTRGFRKLIENVL